MYKILLVIFMSVFMMGCQGNNSVEEKIDTVRDLIETEDNVTTETENNESNDTNNTYDPYRDYSLNDQYTPPSVPEF